MHAFPSKEEITQFRKQYPVGTRVELVAMDDPYAKLKPGDLATVQCVDDAGHLICQWDCGSALNLIPGVDEFRVIVALTEKIREQIQVIRFGAQSNMLDTNTVQRLAYDQGFYELVNLIESDLKSYAEYIITGES